MQRISVKLFFFLCAVYAMCACVSCVFVWRLCSQMTNSMRKRLAERKRRAGLRNMIKVTCKQQAIRYNLLNTTSEFSKFLLKYW